MYRNGKIAKSRESDQLVDELVKGKKIKETFTERGQPRYFIESKDWDRKTKWMAVQYDVNKFKSDVIKLGEKKPMKRLCTNFVTLLDTRMHTLQLEDKHAKQFGIPFTAKSLMELISRLISFSKSVNSKNVLSKIKETEKWVDFELSRDNYYLKHEIKGTSVLAVKEYTKKWLEENEVKQVWQRKDRTFQKHKVARVMRPVFEKLQIAKDRHSHSVSRTDQLFHKQSIKSKRKETEHEFDEIFEKLNAERHRVLFNNPDITENHIIRMVCEKRLQTIKDDHSKSKAYRKEVKILKDTIKQLDAYPTLLHDWFE